MESRVVSAFLLRLECLDAFSHIFGYKLFVLVVVQVKLDRFTHGCSTAPLPKDLLKLAVRFYIVPDWVE